MNRIHGTSPLGRYTIADSTSITPGQLVALNGDGKAVPAGDTAGLKVVGVALMIFDGEVEVSCGVVSLANGSSGAAIALPLNTVLFQTPTKMGKGVLITPTVHGNLLVGPTAEDIQDKEGVNTTAQGLEKVASQARLSAGEVPLRMVITSFAGLRATEKDEDFVLGESPDAPGFFNAAGIESPGLSSAPAIGEYLAEMIAEKLQAVKKENFISRRKDIPCVAEASPDEIQALIAEDPAYGNVICRCETVTEGEIVNAIRRPLGARSLDGVKRRTRAGMGRCQAGFCSPRTMEILARELKESPLTLTKAGGNSKLLVGEK